MNEENKNINGENQEPEIRIEHTSGWKRFWRNGGKTLAIFFGGLGIGGFLGFCIGHSENEPCEEIEQEQVEAIEE